MNLFWCQFQTYNTYKRQQCEEHWLSLTAAELNLLSSEAESPKNSMPISNVPMAPNPVQMMYAVLTGIALWAKYKNTPLNVMLIIAKEIQAQKRSGWVLESVNPNGHPISKIAAIMRNSQCILIILLCSQTMWQLAMFTMMSHTSTAFTVTWALFWTSTLEIVCFTYYRWSMWAIHIYFLISNVISMYDLFPSI